MSCNTVPIVNEVMIVIELKSKDVKPYSMILISSGLIIDFFNKYLDNTFMFSLYD